MKNVFTMFCLVFLATASQASSILINDAFFANGPSESLSFLYNQALGLSTANLYTGYVRFHAEGSGTVAPGTSLDSFYWWRLDNPGQRYFTGAMFYSFNGDPRYTEGDGRAIEQLMCFADGIGYVNPNYPIAYSQDHIYDFVINVGTTPRRLTLGGGDGGTWDNSGGLSLALQQVIPVPEPSSILALLCGIGGLGGALRLKRR